MVHIEAVDTDTVQGRRARRVKESTMAMIETLFDTMDLWRHLPNYQLERRADRAESYYKRALDGLSPGKDWHRAARRYALIRKRAGARAEVIGLWEKLGARGDRTAAVEIAK